MTQVRTEYMRWITAYLWETGRHKEAPEVALRNLPPTFPAFHKNLLAALKAMQQERFEKLRNEAGKWLFALPKAEMLKVLREYDRLKLLLLPAPYRIDWSKQVPFMHPGDLLDKSV